MEPISSKDVSKSLLGEAELTEFQNVTELTDMTIRFLKTILQIWDTDYRLASAVFLLSRRKKKEFNKY